MFPTGVGMARGYSNRYLVIYSVPHGCGDGPLTKDTPGLTLTCSPRVWGWPVIGNTSKEDFKVFPTGVGMARMGK